MKPYKNISENSGVVAYETEKQGIRVKFIDGRTYHYTYRTAGRQHIEEMKKLTEAGKGLSGYISKYVRDNYEKTEEE